MANEKEPQNPQDMDLRQQEENVAPLFRKLQELSDWFYRSSYCIGIWLIRGGKLIRRKATACFRQRILPLKDSVLHALQRKKLAITAWAQGVQEEAGYCADSIHRFSRRVKHHWRHDRAMATKDLLVGAGEGVRWFRKNLLSYVAPVLSIGLLVGVISFFNSMTFGLQVSMGGTTLGVVANESVLDGATNMVQERLVDTSSLDDESHTISLTFALVKREDLMGEDALTDQIIAASGNVIHEATGLYVDGEFIGATTEGEELLLALEERKAAYRTDDTVERVEFVRDVQVKDGLYPVESIVDLENIETEMDSEVAGQRTYTVEAGDAPYTIAVANDMSVSELVELNPGITENCYPGQEVLIAKSEKLLSVQVVKRTTRTESIAYDTVRENDSSLLKGTTKVSVAGQNGVREVTEEVTYVDGQVTSTTVLDTRVIQEPVTEEILVGTRVPTFSGSNSTTGFMWPLPSSRNITSTFGYRALFGDYHTGIDIAAPRGTSIVAAAGGYVEKAIYSVTASEGNYVVINHGNGYKTLYAHCDSLNVSAGQYVDQGQVIAFVGSTGWATGNHLHFEIHVNGTRVNPMPFVS